MAGDDSSGSGYIRDGVQCMEVLRTNLPTQETTLRALADSVDYRFQAFEGRFDDIVDQLNALAIGANRDRNDDRRRLRDDVAQGQPVNRLVPANHCRQLIYSDDSEEEDFLFSDHRPTRGGGRHVRDYDKDCGDFRLKIDILYFSENLNIEDFID